MLTATGQELPVQRKLNSTEVPAPGPTPRPPGAGEARHPLHTAYSLSATLPPAQLPFPFPQRPLYSRLRLSKAIICISRSLPSLSVLALLSALLPQALVSLPQALVSLPQALVSLPRAFVSPQDFLCANLFNFFPAMASMTRSVQTFAIAAVVLGCSMAVSVSAQAAAPAPAPTSDASSMVPAFVAPVVASLLAFVAARMM